MGTALEALKYGVHTHRRPIAAPIRVSAVNGRKGDADHVRYVLGRMLRHLDGSRDLVIELAEGRCPPLVVRLMEGKLTGADERALERLRAGLDALDGRWTA